jgi:hypothetical protein
VSAPEVEAETYESWDAFWAEQAAKQRTETIRGITVPVPSDLPLSLQARLTDLQDSEDEDDVAELVGLLFGEGILDRWRAAGMGLLELQVVLAWGLAHAAGREVTFAQAHAMVLRASEDAAGNLLGPANRAERRAASRSQSAAGGGPSKPTSSASTGSGRKKSRR